MTTHKSPTKDSSVIDFHALITDLNTRITALEDRLKQLEPHPLPEACRDRTCSYFIDYLTRGPADMVHAGYHAAEKRYGDLITRYLAWERNAAESPSRGRPAHNPYEDLVTTWEIRLRI